MDVLAALCDILQCSPNDLIEIEAVNQSVKKAAGDQPQAVPKGATHDRSPAGPQLMRGSANFNQMRGFESALPLRRGSGHWMRRRSDSRQLGLVGVGAARLL